MSNDAATGQKPSGKDEALSRAYRQAAREQPPAALDNAILQMAHAEVNGIHAAPLRPRWFVPLAVAATVVVAVSLGIQVMRDPEAVLTESDFASTAPAAAKREAPQPALAHAPERANSLQDGAAAKPGEFGDAGEFASPPLPSSAPPAAQAREQMLLDAESALTSRQDASSTAKVAQSNRSEMLATQPSLTQPAPEISADADTAGVADLRQYARAAEMRPGELEAAVSPAAEEMLARPVDRMERAVREAAARAKSEQRSANDWLQMIETLHRDGLNEQSVIELRAFQRVFPQAELPAGFPTIE